MERARVAQQAKAILLNYELILNVNYELILNGWEGGNGGPFLTKVIIMKSY